MKRFPQRQPRPYPSIRLVEQGNAGAKKADSESLPAFSRIDSGRVGYCISTSTPICRAVPAMMR